MAKQKIEKTPLEVITQERKADIQKHRIRLNHANMNDMELALNHALIHVQNPSLESLTWIRHYLNRI